MPDLRAAIVKEMDRQGWTKYRMVQALKGKRKGGNDVPSTVVYEFLRGDGTINSDDLGLMLDVLGMTVKGGRK